jgi:hypothetical protein
MNFRGSGFRPQGFGHLMQLQQEQQMLRNLGPLDPRYAGPPWNQPQKSSWGK